MHRRSAVVGALCLALSWVGACGESGTASESGGLTTGGVGGMFATGGIGGGIGGASGAAGVGGMTAGAGGIGGAGAGGMVAAGMGGSGGGMVAGGMGGSGGGMMTGGMGGSGGGMTGGMGGSGGGMMTGGMGGGVELDGDCCPDGNCLCHGPAPTGLTTSPGPYDVESYELTTGTVYYPTDAEPPLAGIAICPGFLNSGPEMAEWGPFYASHGIVLIAAWTLPTDIPDIRAIKLLDAVEELAAENTKSGSPLSGKLAGRFGTSGYSMGGGGTTIAAATDMTLRTSVGLAAWAPVGAGVTVPTLFLCGESDSTARCSQSEGAYAQMPDTTPKMLITIPGATHFAWFGPQDAGNGRSGAYALAFQKVFLEGDERWRPFLTQTPSSGSMSTNID